MSGSPSDELQPQQPFRLAPFPKGVTARVDYSIIPRQAADRVGVVPLIPEVFSLQNVLYTKRPEPIDLEFGALVPEASMVGKPIDKRELDACAALLLSAEFFPVTIWDILALQGTSLAIRIGSPRDERRFIGFGSAHDPTSECHFRHPMLFEKVYTGERHGSPRAHAGLVSIRSMRLMPEDHIVYAKIAT